MAELKKCPFCGGEAEYEKFNDGFFVWGRVECKCGAMLTTPSLTTIEAWNNRVTEAEIRAKAIDEFVKAIKEHTTIVGTTYMCDIVLLAERLKGGAISD